MSLQNLLLLLVAISSLLMSILVLARGVKNSKINLYFSLLTFFNFVWAISEFLTRTMPYDLSLFFNKVTYFSGLIIAISFYYFSTHFPFAQKKNKKIIGALIFLILFILTFIIFSDGLFITNFFKTAESNAYTLSLNKGGYIAYSIFFVLIILVAFYNLFKKYFASDGIVKKNLKVLLSAIAIAFLAGLYFDIILPFFNNYNYFWLAPIFTFLINFVVFRLIYKKDL